MRSIVIILCIALVLVAFFPSAGAQAGSGAGTEADRTPGGQPPITAPGHTVREETPAGQPLDRGPPPERPVDPDEIRTIIREREQKRIHEREQMEHLPQHTRERLSHEHQVRDAVFVLLASENITGIGPHIADIARGFNASFNAQWRNESSIEARTGMMRLLFGGYTPGAEHILAQAEENKQRIQQIRTAIKDEMPDEAGDPDYEAYSLLLKQLDQVEQEQHRLSERAEHELEQRGLFGWLFGNRH